MAVQPRLSLKHVKAAYGRIPVLHNISLDVMPGEVVSLLGANGAGKSTTLRAISGMVPTSGVIKVDDQAINKLPTYEIVRRGVAHVAEGRQLFPAMTVLENLLVGSISSPVQAKETMEKLLVRFPILSQRAKQLAGTLSGGEQQIVAIARALMIKPKVMLLDEPSMGLSPVMVEKLAEVIREMVNEQLTILLVEQNASLALSLSDRAYVIELGNIVTSGTTEELRDDPKLLSAYLGTL